METERASIEALSDLTMEELKDRLVSAENANAILAGRLSTCEARLGVLQAFKQKHESVWGVLTPEEVALFGKCERTLLEQNPGGFLTKYHDALFCRSSMEAAQAECRVQTDALLLRTQSAEEEASRLKAELATTQGLLAEQRQQTRLHRGRTRLAEDMLTVAQAKWKECDEGWCQVGKENDALLQHAQALAEDNSVIRAQSAALAAEVAAFRSDPEWEHSAADNEERTQAAEAELVTRHRAEAECYAASMCDQIKTLRDGRC
jgi:hypothetical protein